MCRKQVKCSNCSASVTIDSEMQSRMKDAIEFKLDYIWLLCETCGSNFRCNPSTETADSFLPIDNNPVLLCPVSGCHGYVSFIDYDDDEESFFGCSDSGDVWFEENNLFKDIENIIERYPHRKDCYDLLDGRWLPAEDQPKNIDKLISSEKKDKQDSYIRG